MSTDKICKNIHGALLYFGYQRFWMFLTSDKTLSTVENVNSIDAHGLKLVKMCWLCTYDVIVIQNLSHLRQK